MIKNNVNELPHKVLEAILSVTGKGPAPLHEPSFGAIEIEYLKECISSSYVSYIGEYVDKFGNQLADFTGAKFVIPTSSGTSALHLALLCGGVLPGDEVLVPALTFIATANAIKYCNAEPHLIDSAPENLGINVTKLREYLIKNTKKISNHCVNINTGKIIRAIVPVHTFGHTGNMEELVEMAEDFNINVVEDAAESLGSYFKGKHTGTFGKLGALSFNGNKIITTGGGGAVMTNDSRLAKKVKHLSTTAKIDHKWEFIHDEIGFNYRMPNINAAVGCAQLEKIEEKISKKRSLFEKYSRAFNGIEEITIFKEPQDTRSNYWLNLILLKKNDLEMRDKILKVTNENQISTRPVWNLLNIQQPYIGCPSMDLEHAVNISNRAINLPSSAQLNDLTL
jgi:perosamine synthetase